MKGELTIKQTGGSPFFGIIELPSDAKFYSFWLTGKQGNLAVRALSDPRELMCLIDPGGDVNPIRFCFSGIRPGMTWKVTGQLVKNGKFTNWSAGFKMID